MAGAGAQSGLSRPGPGPRRRADTLGHSDRGIGASLALHVRGPERNRERRAGRTSGFCSEPRRLVHPPDGARGCPSSWPTSGSTTPFVALLLLAGLQNIDTSLYEAARIDGASAWRQFRHVTLPLLRPAILVALIFRTLDAFRVFDLIYALTGGGPGTSTEPIALYTFNALAPEPAVRLRLRAVGDRLPDHLLSGSGLHQDSRRRADREPSGEGAAAGGRPSCSRCWWRPAPFPSTGPFSPRSRPRPGCSRSRRCCHRHWCSTTIARCSPSEASGCRSGIH